MQLQFLEIIPGDNQLPIIEAIPEQISYPTTDFAALDLNQHGYDPDYEYTYWQASEDTPLEIQLDSNNHLHVTKPAGLD